MKIYQNEDPEFRCAKMAAMICHYAIKNPLHCFFEDGNVHHAPMSFERDLNDKYRTANGELMYEFIRNFLDEFEKLPPGRRLPVYRLYRKRAEYLSRKWRKKLVENSSEPQNSYGSISYKHYLGSDGHIYAMTDAGVELRQF